MVNEVPLVMPKMSMTMTEGTFLVWHKAPGDVVSEGDVVCEVTTDKVDMEVEAPIAGTLTRLLAEPDDVIPVGEPLAYVATEADELLGGLFGSPPSESTVSAGEQIAEAAHGGPASPLPAPEGRAEPPPPTPAASPKPTATSPNPQPATGSPLHRESAVAMPSGWRSVDSSPVPGAGSPSGRAVAATTRSGQRSAGPLPNPVSAAEPLPGSGSASPDSLPAPISSSSPKPSLPSRSSRPAAPAARRRAAERGVSLAGVTPTGPWGTIRLSDVEAANNGHRGRVAVARRMVASTQVPQFVLYRDLDLEAVERSHGWTVLLTRAFAAALRRHPELNASWADGTVQRHDHVGVALAVDTPRGLLAPVLTDPDRGDLDTLASRISDVVGRARAGRLGLAELSGHATTTVSNLGGFGVSGFQALLTPPQATALAVGAIEPKVVPLPGGLGVRLRCTVSLSVDHRVADGADGARLLATLQELL